MRIWLRDNVGTIAIVVVTSALVYNALATGTILTDHTWPNTLAYKYPSFKTYGEARWLADLLIQIFGSGAQVMQAWLGFAIQALNGVLFADLIGVNGRWKRLLIVLLVCLHPVLLDFYSFIADNVSFTLGQTLAIGAALALSRVRQVWLAIVVASLLTMLSLAAYPPLISVVLTVHLAMLLSRAGYAESGARLWREAIRSGAAVVSGTLLYLVTARLALRTDGDKRTTINTLSGIIREATDAYVTVFKSTVGQITNLPALATWAFTAMLVIGFVALLVQSFRKSLFRGVLAAILIAAMPLAIMASYVINSESFDNTGRLVGGYPYAFAVFALPLLTFQLTRWLGGAVVGLATYGFAFIAVQENSYIAAKNNYETQTLNRLIDRIELMLPNDEPAPIVVIGRFTLDQLDKIVQFPKRPLRPHTTLPSFATFRHASLTNYLAGRELVTEPTQLQVDRAIVDAQSHRLWPYEGSVYMLDEIVVVVFSHDGRFHTVAEG